MSEQYHDEGATAQTLADDITAEVSQVVVGTESATELLIIGLLTRGHVLLEGIPGIAKTTLATSVARAVGLEYNRVQMTPDTLPADITGTRIYRERTGEFDLHRGPIFTNVLLVDEINRATPNTQSALLEAMQEAQVSIEGETLPLPDPFLVLATQNPIETDGVFELPEGQRDRFQLKLVLDLPERRVEAEILDRFNADPRHGPGTIEQAASAADVRAARSDAARVYVATAVRDYILDLVEAVRSHPAIVHGTSTRASIAFLNAAKARAAIRGRTYVVPDDVKALAEPVLAHRLVLDADAELRGIEPAEIVADALERTEVPDADGTEWALAAAED
jgi:MoxR-like ATPase